MSGAEPARGPAPRDAADGCAGALGRPLRLACLAGALALALATQSLFFRPSLLGLPCALLFAAAYYRSLKALLLRRRRFRALRALMLFLQHICSHMAAGLSLRSVLLELPQSRVPDALPGRAARGALERALSLIEHRQSRALFLPALLAAFPCPEAGALLHAFELEEQLGGRVIALFREAFDTSRELLLLEKEIAAATAQTRVEGLILTLMPLVMAPVFGDLALLSPLADRASGLYHGLRFFAYLCAATALALQLRLNSRKGEARRGGGARPFKQLLRLALSPSDMHTAHPIDRSGAGALLARALLRLHPEDLTRAYRLIFPEHFFDLEGDAGRRLVLLHGLLLRGAPLALAALAVPLRLAASEAWYWPLFAAISFAALTEAKLRVLSRAGIADLQRDLPLFLASLSRLLKNGLSVQNALRDCGAMLSAGEALLGKILQAMNARIEHGAPARALMESWASVLGLSDAASTLYLLARYIDLGGREVLRLLDRQLDLCWAAQRQSARKRLEAQGGLLLLPMLLDFLAVICLGAAPALQIFAAL